MALNTLCTDILWNLEILRSLEANNTLMVVGDRLSFDNHRFQAIRRTWSGDSRSHIVSAINKTLTLLDEVLVSYQYCVYLQVQPLFTSTFSQEQSDITEKMCDNLASIIEKHEGVNQGFDTIKRFERYTSDIAFMIDVDNAKAYFQRLIAKCQTLSARVKNNVRTNTTYQA